LHRPVWTTLESRLESQPHLSERGLIITWNGRLDNANDLTGALSDGRLRPATDLALLALAFERWGTDCFRRLVGDWVISIWDRATKTLILGADYIGVRHLYYSLTANEVRWSTDLASIVLSSGRSFTLNDEYVAGYLSVLPESHLTPYREIEAVPAGSFVTIREGRATTHRYWRFEPRKIIRYRQDAQYEEQFRHLLRQAVRRRLRSDSPVLGELSGGIDSSSLICVADEILATGGGETERLDTISFHNPEEPSSDDRRYVAKIEQRRGRDGHHFKTGNYREAFSFEITGFSALPRPSHRQAELTRAFHELLDENRYRVVISGIGGDEFLGGIPNPYPQLADLVLSLQPRKLFEQLTAWSLAKKLPASEVLGRTLLLFLPCRWRARFLREARIPAWIDSSFARKHRFPVRRLGTPAGYGFWRPSRREYAQTLIAMRRQLAYFSPDSWVYEERRYPFLDQDLMEFLLAVPASQLLRPGERRSLMRRALARIVPDEILWRPTKGSASRSIIVGLGEGWPDLQQAFDSARSARFGYIDPVRFASSLRRARGGDGSQLVDLIKTVYLELWLRTLTERKVIDFQT
jgi:asparagine synthase (glutamine-hydrolysing)